MVVSYYVEVAVNDVLWHSRIMPAYQPWESLPPRFRFSDPERQITAWRGDRVGKLATGMSCRLGEHDPVDVIRNAALLGDEELYKLIDRHTSTSMGSPLISVTTNLHIAQAFAARVGSTIYEVTIPGHRIVRDPYNTGTPNLRNDTEIFVVGEIRPYEITAVKTNNDDSNASELLVYRDGCSYLLDSLSVHKSIPVPNAPNPVGVWERNNTAT